VLDPRYPIIDLHRHLDGSIRLETILDLARKHDIPLPADTVEGMRPFVQIMEPRPGVMAFIEKFKYMIGVLADYDACRRVAYENLEDAQAEGLDYVELRFSPVFMAEPHDLDPQGVVESVVEGIHQARQELDIRVNLIGIISRTYGPDRGWEELQALLSCRPALSALDLAGDEANFPGRTTIHAGEESGPESIWQAVEELGAERIGHGISAVRDPQLMDYLAEEQIGVECNLTSNLQTQVVKNLSQHPIKEFLEKGILATINTDDPGISGIDLAHEYQKAAPAAGLSLKEIHQAQQNALKVAFLSAEEKDSLAKKALSRAEETP
jgi:adenosine deaminase